MEHYELLVILPAKFTEAELKEQAAKVEKTITGLGATVTATHQLGSRKLAYAIHQARNGSYVLFHFDAETSSLPKMNEVLRHSTDLLRHMIVVRDIRLTAIPSIIEEERRNTRQDAPSSVSANMAQAAVITIGSDAKVDESAS
jgi:ribosomal protein S6